MKSRTRTRSMCTIILREAPTKIACTAYSENRSKNAWANTMIGLLQRVTRADVVVDDQKIAEIGRGLLVLVAVHRDDSERDIARLAERILGYRVFPDATGRMNRSLEDIGGDLLLVPQFTLAADTKKGTRASFTRAAPPEKATAYFEQLCDLCKEAPGARRNREVRRQHAGKPGQRRPGNVLAGILKWGHSAFLVFLRKTKVEKQNVPIFGVTSLRFCCPGRRIMTIIIV